MPENEIKTPSLKSQSAWLLFAKVVSFGFAFLLPFLVVRFLSQEKVGVYRQTFLVVMNAVSILSLGFAMSAYYFLAREIERRSAAVFNILLFHFVMGGIACFALFIKPEILGSLFQSAEMTALAPKIGVVIWIWIFSTFLETVAVANKETRLATAFIIFAQFSKAVLMVGAVIFFGSVDSIINAAIVQGLVQTAILIFYLASRFPRFWKKFDLAFFREHLVYAVPFGFAAVLWILLTDIHNYFVGNRFSEAEFAIYTYGCFQIPLLGMIFESITAVLIPRMSELQMSGEKSEMKRLMARAMSKLAFFHFPLYAFLMITAQTFIITLFTRDYAASVPIFIINLTLLPVQIFVTDPVVRAYKELGRFLLALRVFTFLLMIAALFYGIQYFDLRGMIAIVVGVSLLERLISETVVFRKLGIGRKDFYLFKDIFKTAAVSILAAVFTFAVYHQTKDAMPAAAEKILLQFVEKPELNAIDFVSGILTLGISFIVYAAIYLAGTYFWNIIDEEEKIFVKNLLKKINLRLRGEKMLRART